MAGKAGSALSISFGHQFFIQQGVETRHGAQMQTERDSKCVAKNVDRLSDEVVVGTQIEPARASYQVGHHSFIQQGVGA